MNERTATTDGAPGLEFRDTRIRIGASTRRLDLLESGELAKRCPALAEAARPLAAPKARGALLACDDAAAADAACELLPPLHVLGAMLELTSRKGVRVVPIETFRTGPGKTLLSRGERVEAILLPDPPTRSAFERLGPRPPAPATLTVAASVVLTQGIVRRLTIALGALCPIVLLVPGLDAFRGEPLTDALIAECAVMSAATARIAAEARGETPRPDAQVRDLAKRCLARLK